mmetsp:Transcript_1809/g.3976  ORF Transcript_1809/g.3976 Transcript_1809/m.3976 type:complete len:214 (+) Transcript_1809:319-960(+)
MTTAPTPSSPTFGTSSVLAPVLILGAASFTRAASFAWKGPYPPGIHAFGAGKMSVTRASVDRPPPIASSIRSRVRAASTSMPIGTRSFRLPSSATSRMTCFVNNSHDSTRDGVLRSLGGLVFVLRWTSLEMGEREYSCGWLMYHPKTEASSSQMPRSRRSSSTSNLAFNLSSTSSSPPFRRSAAKGELNVFFEFVVATWPTPLELHAAKRVQN